MNEEDKKIVTLVLAGVGVAVIVSKLVAVSPVLTTLAALGCAMWYMEREAKV